MATYSGSSRTWVAGETVTAALMNSDVRDPLAALTGAWNSYTPQIDQGASTNIGKTIGYAKYVRVGKFVRVQAQLALTGAGTSGSEITVTLPVARAYSGSSFHVVGNGMVADVAGGSGAQACNVTGVAGSASAVKFVPTGTTTGMGASPNSFALASGDVISFTCEYEAA